MREDGRNEYQDFLDANPKYGKYAHNNMAENIFNTMSELETIQKMILVSEADKPALSACISQIESQFGNQKMFDLSDDFAKQCVGTMVKVILEPFGYTPIKQKDMPKGLAKYFASASVYKLNKEPRIRLVQKLTIEKVE